MNLKHEFNRIGHLFNGGLEKTHKETEHWAEKGAKRANEIARRVKKQADTGAQSVVTLEESLVQHVRDNPAIYIVSLTVVVGVLIAKLLLEGRRKPEPPLL